MLLQVKIKLWTLFRDFPTKLSLINLKTYIHKTENKYLPENFNAQQNGLQMKMDKQRF